MGSARTDQNFTSANKHATLDGVVYFLSFEFTKLLTLSMYHDTADATFFLKVSENSMKRNLL